MNCEDYKDKIISYIENDLNETDRRIFESELCNNEELKSQYNEMKNLLSSLKNLPEVKTSRNFMVSLNSKIDEYDTLKNAAWYNNILDSFTFNINSIQKSVAVFAIICIVFIGYNVLDTNNSKPLMLSKSNFQDNSESVDLSDSEIDSLLNSEEDSSVE